MPPTLPFDSAAGDSQRHMPLRPRGHATPSASSAAADEALRQLVDLRRRRKRSAAASPRRRSRPALVGSLKKQAALKQKLDCSGIGRWAPRVLGGAACAGLLATAAFLLAPQSTRLHGVKGSVRVNDEPLRHCILEFQSQDPVASGRLFRTVIHPNADGTFRRDAACGLPAGTYAVAVKPHPPAASGRARAPAIPAAYTQVASTPLRIEIRGAAEALDLVVKQ